MKTESSQRPGKRPPRPEIWDFRPVAETEVAEAARYEYCRESEAVIAAVVSWHAQSLSQLFSHQRETIEQAGKHGSQRIKALLSRFDELPQEIRFIVRRSPTFVALNGLGPLLWRFPEFPKPFLTIKPELRMNRLRAIHAEVEDEARCCGRRPLYLERANVPIYPAEIAQFHYELKNGVAHYVARIDWRWGKKAIKREFVKWITDQQAPVGRSRGKSGLAASVAVHYAKLKFLAAYRLAKHGLNSEEAKALCEKQRVEKPGDKFGFPCLPKYDSAASWGNALSDYHRCKEELLGAV